MNENLLALTGDVVSAHVSANTVSANDVATLINTVYAALQKLGTPVEAIEEASVPAVSIKASVKPDGLICLNCGKRFQTLRGHIKGHDLTEAGYRAKWKLPADYPMVTADYSNFRKEMAKRIGLGRKPKVVEPAAAPKGGKKLGITA